MSEPIRFYTDEHVGKAVIKGLRQRGADVLTVPETGLLGASDEEHLKRAREERRVIVTHDDDFLALAAAGHRHAGIVFARQGTPVGHVIRGLILIHQCLEPEEMEDHVEFL